MTKSELVDQLALKQNITAKAAEHIVNTIFSSMSDALVNEGRIEVRGFGSFQIRQYDSYDGRNPKTGQIVKVKPKKSPFFKVGRDLKERIMGSGLQGVDYEKR
jgi:integration host factor subunit beta